ncbi:uncharacterized protein MONBRDRAFT_4746 [Monosiga brevicollis MX1]|uniref:Nucleotide-diphospho-sugar transferase domain-containing protein n=1 Tax=Monosiga brevicollis TaxID=81824 RepID=A9UNT8_MONBE|nr:uncharacterized protein MONBRDRAFT_4746 [Monosiga brevicollis MX1]EDQ92757.1 predicted protein [Monosiga brevicollis MX1]|eukprot:XP_001742519.1 hypothetical protein [Monosiga brevicollis MX1]
MAHPTLPTTALSLSRDSNMERPTCTQIASPPWVNTAPSSISSRTQHPMAIATHTAPVPLPREASVPAPASPVLLATSPASTLSESAEPEGQLLVQPGLAAAVPRGPCRRLALGRPSCDSTEGQFADGCDRMALMRTTVATNTSPSHAAPTLRWTTEHEQIFEWLRRDPGCAPPVEDPAALAAALPGILLDPGFPALVALVSSVHDLLRPAQRRAIESWVKLEPKPEIVLVGYGAGYEDVAAEFGCVISRHLDMNFKMLPLAGSLVHLASEWDTDVSVIVNSDILLTQSLPDAIAKVRSQFTDWFITGARYDLDELPPMYEPARPDFNEAAFMGYVKTKGTLHTAGGLLTPRYDVTHMTGKSKFDNWFVHEVIQAGYRDVVDTTESVVAVHVQHDYTSASGVVQRNTGGGTFWMKSKTSDWMIFHNAHLALTYGSYRNQDGTTLHAPWKLVSCMEPGGMCLLKRLRPGLCPCEHNAFALNTQNDPEIVEVFENDRKKNLVKCASISIDKREKFDIPVKTEEGHPPAYGLPFTLRDLLPVVARDNHVLVTGASYAYRDVVMNFVCQLRKLGIYDQLVIAAFDEDMYRFGFRMGLPVFFYQASDISGLTSHDLEYGSQHFKKVTKLKSQVVLQILKLGYDVTWTGFYRVRATPMAIVAMEQVVAHAATSTMTEQPSFYIILCGGKEGATTQGDDKCLYTPPRNVFPTQAVLEVEFLDRQRFPAGAVGGFWGLADIAVEQPQLVLLHNNWVKGLRAKIRRFTEHKMWRYNRNQEICDYSDAPSYNFDWQPCTYPLGFVQLPAWYERTVSQWRLAVDGEQLLDRLFWYMTGAAMLYLPVIFGLRQLMANRAPFKLKMPLVLWNILLVIFNVYAFYYTAPTTVQHALNGTIMPETCHLLPEGHQGPTSMAIFAFALSKIPEMGDTLFLVLKKRPVITLHWWHHLTVMLYCWNILYEPKYNQGTEGIIFAAMNSLVHIIMYSYYAARALGYRPVGDIWITSLQILQMVVGTYIASYRLTVCNSVRPESAWGALIMYASYFYLFADFFARRYLKPGPQSDKIKAT